MPESIFSEYAIDTGITSANRKEWLTERRKVVTASAVAALFGMHPKLDAFDLYSEMLSKEPIGDVELGLNDPRTWGLALEEAIALTAAKYYGWKLQMSGRLLLCKELPCLGATLDAEIIDDGEGRACSYEGKTWDSMRRRDWDEETGAAPDYILIQAQTQLVVTHAPVNHVCCLIGGNKWAHIPVKPDDEMRDLILKTTDAFMDQVKRLEPPPVTHRSADAIRRLHPRDSGAVVELSTEALEWAQEAHNLAEQIKLLEEQREELRNKLRLAIGDATYGVFQYGVFGDDKTALKYAIQDKKEHIVRASTSRPLLAVKSLPKGFVPTAFY